MRTTFITFITSKQLLPRESLPSVGYVMKLDIGKHHVNHRVLFVVRFTSKDTINILANLQFFPTHQCISNHQMMSFLTLNQKITKDNILYFYNSFFKKLRGGYPNQFDNASSKEKFQDSVIINQLEIGESGSTEYLARSK